MNQSLRKCRDCGLEVWNKENLKKFVKGNDFPYGRRNLCKNCSRKRDKKYSLKYPLRMRYKGILNRCYNSNDPIYRFYGGRGIYVCDEWRNNRQAFIDWAKENGFSLELQIDRINTYGPYSPENCRWIKQKEQAKNTRRNVTNWDKGTRICEICKVEKPFSEFHKCNRTDCSGYTYVCKNCERKRRKISRNRAKLKHR